jgi:hypothetical protein
MEPMSVRRAAWIAHVKSWRDSDLTQAAYCRRHALNSKTMAACIKRCNTSAVPANLSLTLELTHLKRIRFGVKNEALSPEQRDLFRETLEVDGAAIAAETELLVPALHAPSERAGRQPLPEHLPRIEHRHEPASCSCGECGGVLVKIG